MSAPNPTVLNIKASVKYANRPNREARVAVYLMQRSFDLGGGLLRILTLPIHGDIVASTDDVLGESAQRIAVYYTKPLKNGYGEFQIDENSMKAFVPYPPGRKIDLSKVKLRGSRFQLWIQHFTGPRPQAYYDHNPIITSKTMKVTQGYNSVVLSGDSIYNWY